MTQEQKAKRYDEAIARAKAILKVTDNMRESLLYVSTIFPELKESEDERIRKDLIQWINEFPDTIWRGHYKKDVVAWLEKQGEIIFSELKESEDEKIRNWLIGYFHQYKEDGMEKYTNGLKVESIIAWLEKQGEQKSTDKVEPNPVWSEEDEWCLENAIMYCEWARDKAPDVPCYETSENSIKWLKSLKNRVQPKQEWSEEDERFYDMICEYFDDGRAMGEDEINEFLKWLWLLSKKNKRTT